MAAGLVGFALGTDTAGSGRVPAAFNNIVGLKPTRGLLSTRGVVPACRSLDCVSIFALTASDAADRAARREGLDAPIRSRAGGGAGARCRAPRGARFGVPRDRPARVLRQPETAALSLRSARFESLGGTSVDIDFTPFLEAARLLYEGPWVAERYLAIRDFIERSRRRCIP